MWGGYLLPMGEMRFVGAGKPTGIDLHGFANCKIAAAAPWAYLNGMLPQLAKLEEGADVAHLYPVLRDDLRMIRTCSIF